MTQRASDRWISIALSVLLHGALLAALVYGWWIFRQQRAAAPTPPIQATVVSERALRGAVQPAPQPAAAPTQAPEEAVGPPPPTPQELAQREQQEREAKQAAEQAAQQKAAAEAAAKAAAEKAAAERAAAERAAAAKAAQKAAAEKAAAEKAAAEKAAALDQSEREADLKRSLAAEERADAARDSTALANWQSMIAAKITRAWLRPPTARVGIDCILSVTQVPGGEVTQVSIGECNGDQAVRQSIEAAVYRASPLPPPPDPALFDRNLTIRFKPD
jgi:colicin import membrane protein